ncbi:MAG: molybdopterin-synthase adenylyltransferase MoeB [Elusimicrobiota bacterium]
MSIKVRIPQPLQKFTHGKEEVQAQASSVKELIDNLNSQYPGIKERLVDESGRVRRFINIYVNEEDVRFLQGDSTKLKDGDEVSIIHAIAGGSLNDSQIERYSRQIILPHVGGKGQRKLLDAKVLLIGVGGLGSPVALYLTGAGVGTLGILDSDNVELNNLHRQIIYSTDEIGKNKVEVAVQKLKRSNPDVNLIPHSVRLTSQNAMKIIGDYDIVVDASDNFPTRYLVNDACVLSKKSLVHGAFFRYDGQAMVIKPQEGPCYRCLFPEPPPPGVVPACQEAGVLGALAGVIGLIQATETLKLILGVGEPLVGKLIIFNSFEMSFRKLSVPRDKNCPVCGENPTVKELIDYEWFCGIKKV